MGRKFIPTEVAMKQRKIFLDDLRRIHKRRVKSVPAIPAFTSAKADDQTICLSESEEG